MNAAFRVSSVIGATYRLKVVALDRQRRVEPRVQRDADEGHPGAGSESGEHRGSVDQLETVHHVQPDHEQQDRHEGQDEVHRRVT